MNRKKRIRTIRRSSASRQRLMYIEPADPRKAKAEEFRKIANRHYYYPEAAYYLFLGLVVLPICAEILFESLFWPISWGLIDHIKPLFDSLSRYLQPAV